MMGNFCLARRAAVDDHQPNKEVGECDDDVDAGADTLNKNTFQC